MRSITGTLLSQKAITIEYSLFTNHLMQRRIQALKDKRAAKEEKVRYEKLAETMHRKRVERLKRKEKRNKMLKS